MRCEHCTVYCEAKLQSEQWCTKHHISENFIVYIAITSVMCFFQLLISVLNLCSSVGMHASELNAMHMLYNLQIMREKISHLSSSSDHPCLLAAADMTASVEHFELVSRLTIKILI